MFGSAPGGTATFSPSSGPSSWSFATSSNQQAPLFSHTGPFQTNNAPRFGDTDPFSGFRTFQLRGSRIKSYATPVDEETGMKFSSISVMETYCNKSHEELKWEDYQLEYQGNQTIIVEPKLTSISAMDTFCGKSHEELKWEDYQLKSQGASGPLNVLPNTSSTLLTSNQPSKSYPSSFFTCPKISKFSGFDSSFSQSNATATSPPLISGTTLSSISSSFSGCAFSNVTANLPLSWGPSSNAATNSSPFTNNAAPQPLFYSQSSGATSSSFKPGFTDWSSSSPFSGGAFANQATLSYNLFTEPSHNAPSSTLSYNLFTKPTYNAPSFLSPCQPCNGSSPSANKTALQAVFPIPLTITNTCSGSLPFPSPFNHPFLVPSFFIHNSLTNNQNLGGAKVLGPFQPSTYGFSSTGSLSGNTSSTMFSQLTPSIVANLLPSQNHAANAFSGSSVSLNIDPSFSQWPAHSGQTVAPVSSERNCHFPANGQGQLNIANNHFPASENSPSNSTPLFPATDASIVDIVSVGDPFGVQKGGSHSSSGHAASATSCQGISSMTVPFFIHGGNLELPIPTAHTAPRENIPSVITNSLPVTCQAATGGNASQLNLGEKEPALGNKADKVSMTNLGKGEEALSSKSSAAHTSNGDNAICVTVPPIPESKKRTSVEEITPKLHRCDYYTEPAISVLAIKEELEPGFMGHVRGFTIGRHGYGHIEFEGETDVRGLDLDTIIHFNFREVMVYMNGTHHPPAVGQGLNKPALVTLLNVKCIDKNTGEEYVEGKKVEIYKKMLKRAVEQQGAEFVSYDPVAGEWKFRMEHF